MMFDLDPKLLTTARAVLAPRRRAFWILGAACAGKSTICRLLCQQMGMPVIDMDERIYGGFAYRPDRHPANTAWLSAPNPLAWALALAPAEFDRFNRAATAEYLDLLAAELAATDPEAPLLIDGGITHPSLLAQAMRPAQIACLTLPAAERARIWETAEDRADMRGWIAALPDGPAAWRKFLLFDRLIADTMEAECRAWGITVLPRVGGISPPELAAAVARSLGL